MDSLWMSSKLCDNICCRGIYVFIKEERKNGLTYLLDKTMVSVTM